MTIFRVAIQPDAAAEIDDIAAWIAAGSPVNAERWIERLLEQIQGLCRYPRRCPLAPEDAYFREEIRQLICGNYRVLYTIDRNVVRVVHVRHAARRPIGESEEE